MWRRSNLPGNPDSEQSISEEEEEQVDGRGLLLQTKLEKLIGGCGGEPNYAGETGYISLEATPRKISSSLEEVPDSPEESYFASSTRDGLRCISAQASVPDDEMPHDDPVATWSTISREAKSLLHLNGIASVSSSHSSALRAKRGGSKAVKDNVRPKFSFHSHAHGETSSKISDMAEYFEPPDDDQAAIEEDPIAECPNSDDISDNTEDADSMLLIPPPDKIIVTNRSSKSYSRRQGKSLKFAHKGSSTNIQDSDSTDDELPGPMDSGSSTDDEPIYQSSVPNITNQKKQFVGDLFNEAVKASSLNKEGHSFDSPKLSGGSSLYGKLQQIMKQEKEMEIEITKKLQGGMGQADASSFIDMKIVSRHLEGKLVVCKCSVIDLPGDSLLFKNTQALAARDTETTVIFNPKVCVDVDIEIGSFVRVHAPWKEMEVKNTMEVIILCSYFSSL
ncbi:BnaA08g27290D [Brassica napus]|uniref:BnaA08g27290D protein n=1 Tax=Brassica napus TaxID=3708 RepID=A0A078FLY9_BRANA|nr:BnaA08g27290D [Brassica napus]